MELNKKCLDVLACLRDSEDYISTEELAQLCGISARGVRYNLDKIEQYMVAHSLPYFEKERTRGVRLPQTQPVRDFMSSLSVQLNPYQYSYSFQERQTLLRVLLLMTTTPMRAEDLCRMLERSRNTVLSDLEETESFLSAQDMALVRKPRVGFFCAGDEFRRRQLITRLMMEELPHSDLLGYCNGREPESKGALLLLRALLSPSQAQTVLQSAKRGEELLHKNYSDEAFVELLVQLTILLRRSGKATPALGIPNEDMIPLSNEYGVARLLLDEFESRSGQLYPEAEARYLTYYLLGAKVMPPQTPELAQEDNTPLQAITRNMVADIERIYGVSFGEQRAEVENGILLHLKPAVHRIRYGLYSYNPIYNEIVSNYHALFINTRIVCGHLKKYIGRPVNDQEVSYIALHFAAALHRLNLRTNDRTRVLLVCGTGLGSAQIIRSQVETMFNIEVVGAVSGREAAKMDKSSIDCIISTIPLPHEDVPDCIIVSPLFTEQDRQNLAKRLTQRYIPKEKYDQEVNIANRMIAIVEKHCVVKNRLHLQYQLLNELMNITQPLPMQNAQHELRLCDLLTRDRLALGVACANDWRQAIAVSATTLETAGVITENYKSAIIHNTEDFGPYMVMLPGMVLAHASPYEGVNAIGMSLTVLSTPVTFGYQAHDPVSVIVTLAAQDEKSHLKALAQLFRMFRDSSSLRVILHGTKDEILQCVALHSQ